MDMTGNKYRCCFDSAVFAILTQSFLAIQTSGHFICIALLLPVGLCFCDGSVDRIIGWEGHSTNHRQQGFNRFSPRLIKHTDVVRPVVLQPGGFPKALFVGKVQKNFILD